MTVIIDRTGPMKIGYARVSTEDQSLDIQIEKLKAAGCDHIFAEKRSGAAADNRPALQECLSFLAAGDTLVITRVDRLARSIMDLARIVDGLRNRGIAFNCTEQSAVNFDPGQIDSMAKMVLGIFGVFAEFERDIRAERQREGIAKAKAEGKFKGRGRTYDHEKVVASVRFYLDPKNGPDFPYSAWRIAKELKMSRTTMYDICRPHNLFDGEFGPKARTSTNRVASKRSRTPKPRDIRAR